MQKPTHFDGCAGIAGFSVAAHWAGFYTQGFCEIDPFCKEIITNRFPGRPIFGDIRDVTRESLRNCGIGHIDLQTWGFPCQPFSFTGKRLGAQDDRHLWPEVLRVVADTRPTWLCCENVAGLITLGLDVVLSDLESIGYTTRTFSIPACAVDAPHVRERIWIVSYDARSDRGTRSLLGSGEIGGAQESVGGLLSTSMAPRWESRSSWPECRPDVRRMAHGVSRGVDRLRTLGNAISPRAAYPILKVIHDDLTAVERER